MTPNMNPKQFDTNSLKEYIAFKIKESESRLNNHTDNQRLYWVGKSQAYKDICKIINKMSLRQSNNKKK